MNNTTNHIDSRSHRPGIRLLRARNLLAVLFVGLTLFLGACSSIWPGSGGTDGSQPSTPSSGSSRSTSGYTVAFAECMRSHGMPNFPNPNGNGSAFGPGSGIDPASQQFQQALQACKDLAPASWISSGPSSGAP